MAHTVESRISTPAADLRNLLDRAERQLPTLDGATVAEFLTRLDRIAEAFGELQAEHATQGADPTLRAEQGRWADLQQQVTQRSAQIVKAANVAGGYTALRSANPPATGAWWHLDAHIAMQKRGKLRRFLLTALVVGLFTVAGVWAYQTWLAPDAATIALVDALNTIERHVDAHEWDAAFVVAEGALQAQPTDPELLVWAVVLAERRGDAGLAAQYSEQARAELGGDEVRFQLALGMDRYRAGDLDGATAAVDQAAGLQPDEPQVYFLYGNIAEARGDINAALDAFDRSATLAEADDPQLAVISKMRYGMLIQQLQAVPGLEPTESAGETTAPAATPSP
jgi:cytochrome c-type biogenesis protein CcmH/NrfG